MLPLHISDKALTEVKNIISHKSIPKDYGLRIGMKGAGCGGMSFLLGFDHQKEGDDVFEKEGLTIYIEKKHLMYLIGMEVDFYEGSDARGFTFAKEGNESN